MNDTTIKCLIPISDLTERGITPEDIVGQKKEALQFLHDVIVTGARQMGISPDARFTTLQLAIINQDLLVMLASQGDCKKEVEDFWKDLNNQVRGLNEALRKEAVSNVIPKGGCFAFSLRSLFDAISLSEILPLDSVHGLSSSLYKDRGKNGYTLVLCADGSVHSGPALFGLTSEFGQLTVLDKAKLSFLKEQSQCVISEHAIERLRFVAGSGLVPSLTREDEEPLEGTWLLKGGDGSGDI